MHVLWPILAVLGTAMLLWIQWSLGPGLFREIKRQAPPSRLNAQEQRHAAMVAASIVTGSICLLAIVGITVWLATHSGTWALGAVAFSFALAMLIGLAAGSIAGLHSMRRSK